MPPSKQARSRQARQKERLAAAAARRHQVQQRRRRVTAAGAASMIVVLVVLVFAFAATGGNGKKAASTATTTTAIAETISAKGKPCVAVADPLPKGAPAVPVQTGPAPTKLVKKDLKLGTGPIVPPGATVVVNYIGVACSTGKIFDYTYGKQPFTAPLQGGVLTGWIKGLPGMRIGGRRLLGIPPVDAYGSSGSGPIEADESLWFVVDAIALK